MMMMVVVVVSLPVAVGVAVAVAMGTALELLAHVIGVLSVGVVLGLDVVDAVAESGGVEGKGGAVAASDVEGDVLGAEDGLHSVLGGGHELGGEAELAVGAENSKGGDVAVAGLGGVLLHFRENVSDDLAAVVLRHEEQLRPGKDVVQVVLHLVVLRQAQQVASLHR